MYQTDFHLDSIRICAGNARSAPFVWYEEPIVIEPEKNIHPKPLSVSSEDTELVSTESFLPIFTLTHILLLAKCRCQSVPNQELFRSRIRHQFHVVDVSTTFSPVSVISSMNLLSPGENIPELSENIRNWEIESTLELLLLTTKSSKSWKSHSFGTKDLYLPGPAGVPRWMPDEAPPSSSRCIDAIRIASRVKHVGCVCCVIVAASRAPASRRLLTSLNEACD